MRTLGFKVSTVGILVPLVLALVLCVPLMIDRGASSLTAGLMVVLFVFMLFKVPHRGILGLLLFLMTIGDIRRYVSYVSGYSSNDPILLVAPTTLGLTVVMLLINRRIKVDTRLSKAMGALVLLLLFGILNPLQGGITVGLGGALLLIPPLLWFWIGKVFGTEALLRDLILKLFLPLMIIAALYGLYQTFNGYFDYQAVWIDRLNWWRAFKLGDAYRPLGYFSTPLEYANFVGVALAICMVGVMRDNKILIALLPLFLIAIFTAVSRGPVVRALVVIIIVWSILPRSMLVAVPRMAIAGALGLFALLFILPKVQDAAEGTALQSMVDHQTEGLLDPANEKKSTAGVHASMVLYGFSAGFTNPIGMGTGAATVAGLKGGGHGASTEVDLSDMFIRLGLPGGLLFIYICGAALKRTYDLWQLTRSSTYLYALVLLITCLGSWLAFGTYAATAMIWLIVGVVDRVHAAAISDLGAVEDLPGGIPAQTA